MLDKCARPRLRAGAAPGRGGRPRQAPPPDSKDTLPGAGSSTQDRDHPGAPHQTPTRPTRTTQFLTIKTTTIVRHYTHIHAQHKSQSIFTVNPNTSIGQRFPSTRHEEALQIHIHIRNRAHLRFREVAAPANESTQRTTPAAILDPKPRPHQF